MRSLPKNTLTLFLGDVAALYASLFLALIIRYGAEFQFYIDLHLLPFTLIFTFWILIFYVAGLYDVRHFKNEMDFLKIFSVVLVITTLVTISIFYFSPWFGIAPRTNLSIFVIVFAVVEVWWRRMFHHRIRSREGATRIVIFGTDPKMAEIAKTLRENPQMGYEVILWIKETPSPEELGKIRAVLESHNVDMIVIPRGATKNLELAKIFYELIYSGVFIYDLPSFYEKIFRKIPISDIEESWFLEHVNGRREFYDDLKRAIEFTAALFMAIVLSPLILLVAILTKITSAGPAIYKQERVGRNGQPFMLYKFRSMRQDAEKNGVQWAEDRDPRVTFLGRILRYSHIDELPQLWNIVRGDLSFVGPRPERPEFVALLNKEVPYYNIRHVIKPGVTGWAQINYRYGNSIEQTYEKLQYDLFYLKNRSPVLDLIIAVKTLKSIFVNQE